MNKISFIIPVFNEVKTVKQAIQEVVELNYENKEIVIIDNGSTDGSVDILRSFENKNNVTVYYKKKNTGYGSSIKKGFEMSSGKYAYIQYADLEYDLSSCIEMCNLAEDQNLDIIFGERFEDNIKLNKDLIIILKRKPSYLATFICTFLINIFYKKNFKDIIGAKLYNLERVKKIKIDSNGAGYDFELVGKLCKYNYSVGEVFVKYIPRKYSSEKKIKFYHMFVALYQIFRVKFFI